MPRGVKPVMVFGGLCGGSEHLRFARQRRLLPSSRRPIRPGTPAFAYQIDPSVGFTMIPYETRDPQVARRIGLHSAV
jgi:hypothetical protein